MPYHRDYDKQVYGAITQARCPRCDKAHKLRINWIGNGVPRIFCPRCRATIERNQALSSDDVTHPVGLSTRWSRVPMGRFEHNTPISQLDLIPHYR